MKAKQLAILVAAWLVIVVAFTWAFGQQQAPGAGAQAQAQPQTQVQAAPKPADKPTDKPAELAASPEVMAKFDELRAVAVRVNKTQILLDGYKRDFEDLQKEFTAMVPEGYVYNYDRKVMVLRPAQSPVQPPAETAQTPQQK